MQRRRISIPLLILAQLAVIGPVAADPETPAKDPALVKVNLALHEAGQPRKAQEMQARADGAIYNKFNVVQSGKTTMNVRSRNAASVVSVGLVDKGTDGREISGTWLNVSLSPTQLTVRESYGENKYASSAYLSQSIRRLGTVGKTHQLIVQQQLQAPDGRVMNTYLQRDVQEHTIVSETKLSRPRGALQFWRARKRPLMPLGKVR